MPWTIIQKKLKLNGSMKTYKTFSTNTPKRCPFHCRGLEYKSRKSRNTWSNRHIWPWSTEWSRAKANRVLPREHTGHSKHPVPTTQEKTLHMDITRWSTPKSDFFFTAKDGENLYSQQKKTKKKKNKKKNDWELTVAQIMNSFWQVQFSSVQSLSRVQLVAIPWIATRQASLSITNSGSSLKLTSIESVMPSSHLILCRPLLLLPPIPPSISLFQWVNSSHEVAKVLEFQL